MATVIPITKTRERAPRPRSGGGGRPPVIDFPHHGGGGDGGRDDSPDFGEKLKRYRLGLMIGMVSVVMLFITFSTTFMFRHHLKHFDMAAGVYVSDWRPVPLPYELLFFNTAVLLLSSFTVEKARRAAFQHAVVAPITALPGIAPDRGPKVPWVGITGALGMIFLMGQVTAWRELLERGYLLAANPANSFFYLLTGLHAVHLAGGVLALGYAVATTYMSRPLERKRVVVDVVAWYWHFMSLLWVYVFAVVALG